MSALIVRQYKYLLDENEMRKKAATDPNICYVITLAMPVVSRTQTIKMVFHPWFHLQAIKTK